MVDLRTGSRRSDVTASVGELWACRSGRYVAVVDYDRQHSVAVHRLDGLLRQLAAEDAKTVCSGNVEVVENRNLSSPSPLPQSADDRAYRSSETRSQPASGMTVEEFSRRCRRPPPPPVCLRQRRYILCACVSRKKCPLGVFFYS